MKSIQPKKQIMKINIGTHSNQKSILLLKYVAFPNLKKTPNVIWITPKSTDSFIFREFMYIARWWNHAKPNLCRKGMDHPCHCLRSCGPKVGSNFHHRRGRSAC